MRRENLPIKYCEICGKQLILTVARDIIRKKTCSVKCRGILQGQERSQEIHIKTIKCIKCKKCNKLIRKHGNINGLCLICFNKSKIGSSKYKSTLTCDLCGNKISQYSVKMCKKCQLSLGKISLITLICKNCGKAFQRFPCQVSAAKCCSRSCASLYYLKDHVSPLYIDGRTSLRILIKNSTKYEEFVQRCLIRDEFKCVICSSVIKLHVHHIKSFSEMFTEFSNLYCHLSIQNDKEQLLKYALQYEPFWNINNAETLCKLCHAEEHPEVNLFRK